jgi:hypothetical protein
MLSVPRQTRQIIIFHLITIKPERLPDPVVERPLVDGMSLTLLVRHALRFFIPGASASLRSAFVPMRSLIAVLYRRVLPMVQVLVRITDPKDLTSLQDGMGSTCFQILFCNSLTQRPNNRKHFFVMIPQTSLRVCVRCG